MPASGRPKRVLLIFFPVLDVIASGHSNTTAFVQTVPSPIPESIMFEFQNTHGMRELIAFPRLSLSHDVSRWAQLQIRDGSRLVWCGWALGKRTGGQDKGKKQT